jgi:hypothetical protein
VEVIIKFDDVSLKKEVYDKFIEKSPYDLELFKDIIEEDIHAIEYGISHGYLEGFKISRVDQFARKIHLELLVPNIDSYTITNKNYTTNFTSFYRSEDLHSFYNNNVNQSSQINLSNNKSFFEKILKKNFSTIEASKKILLNAKVS